MLRTTMAEGKLAVDGVNVDYQNVEWFQAKDVCHDASYAHALVMAIGTYDFVSDNESIEQAILRSADEIMAEWGREGNGDERG